MTLLYLDPLFQQHQTGRHPESPERIITLIDHLRKTGLADRCRSGKVTPAGPEVLQRAHAPAYIDQVRRFAEQGGGRIEQDTVVSPRSYNVALHACGAAVSAVEQVLRGPDRQALCLVRPPGHHALAGRAMGFCLFNNIAVAAAAALADHGLSRVLVVDWDVHHGNGTQDLFYDRANVFFYSIHRYPFYPGTGTRDETGTGKGLGFTRNDPIRFGTSRADYLAQFRNSLAAVADKMRPELVLLSAGFDNHKDDPVGSLGLESEDFVPLTEAVLEQARTHCGGRLVSVLEGGYNVDALAACVHNHLQVLLREDRAARD